MGGGGCPWLLGLLQCTVWHLNMASRFTKVYSWPLGVNYKKMISPFVNGLRLVNNIFAVLCMVHYWECNYEVKLNVQPVRERVTASE